MFLRRQLRWSVILISKNFPQFVEIHTVKGFSVLNESEVDALLEFSCFFCDPTDIDNLISGFSKSSLYIWKSSVHVLVKPSLEDFEHHFASMWNECDCAVVWTWVNELWEMVRDRDSGVLQSMRSQRVGHVWAPEQHWYQETWEIKKQEGDLEGYLKQCELPLAGSSCCQFVIHQGVIRWVTAAY